MIQSVVRAAVDSNFKEIKNKVTALGSLVILTTLWGLGGIVTTSAQHPGPAGGNNHTIIGGAVSATQPHGWLAVLGFIFVDILTLQGLYLAVSAATGHLSAEAWERYSPGLSLAAHVRLPRMLTIAVGCIAVWLCYGGYVAWVGVDNPVVANAGFTVAEIVARQSAYCSLVLSWQFWACVAGSVVVPAAAAHVSLSGTVSQARAVKSNSHWDRDE